MLFSDSKANWFLNDIMRLWLIDIILEILRILKTSNLLSGKEIDLFCEDLMRRSPNPDKGRKPAKSFRRALEGFAEVELSRTLYSLLVSR